MRLHCMRPDIGYCIEPCSLTYTKCCENVLLLLCVEIETCRMMKEAAKAAEQRKKTVIVGDMQPLADALPTLSNDTMSRM